MPGCRDEAYRHGIPAFFFLGGRIVNNRLLVLLLGGLAGLLLIALIVAGWAILRDSAGEPEATEGTAVAAATTEPVAAPETATATRELPPPIVEILPTDTPLPTPTPTDTPVPTNTPVPSETPTPTATPTNTRPPAVIQTFPTNTPPPAPTNTPVPVNTNGLSASFSLEGGPVYATGADIWFNFNVTNASGGPVAFGALGVYPRKGGQDRLDMFQFSWTDQVITTGGLEWRDHINLDEAGAYTLRLAICFDADFNACREGGGRWVSLSGEIPITVQ
jgi:hypothetical protein